MKRLNLKNTRKISIMFITLLSVIFHFGYDMFPSFLTSIFFPVNESIWEHMKLLFTSVCLYGIIDYLILTKHNIKHNNFLLSLFITSFTIIPIFLILYLPLYYTFGPKLILNLGIMIISIIISQIISYYILNFKKLKLEKISFILIVLSYIILGMLTYNPIKSELFIDPIYNEYGIISKNKKNL